MSLRFATPAWCDAVRDAINASSEYRNAAARWGVGFNGTLLFAFEADRALPTPRHVRLGLRAGQCTDITIVPDAGLGEAGFALRAPFSLWKEILDRKTLAATAILTGRMRVEGDRLTLLRHAGAHRALIHVVAGVATEYPGTGS